MEVDPLSGLYIGGCDADGNVNKESCPNGSINNIAGIINSTGNILGMMPHPERRVDALLGVQDGLPLFQSMHEHIERN